MEQGYLQLTLCGAAEDAEALAAVMTMLDDSLMIEDLSDLSGDSPYGEIVSDELLARQGGGVCAVSVFLPPDTPLAVVMEATRARLQGAGLCGELHAVNIKEEDWAENWKRYYHPIPFGRLTVVPAWEEYTPAEGEAVLPIDPGTAFGTATHESTYMMMELLCEEIKGGERVYDIGCGSGILAMAARLLGASSAAAYDLDEEAVRVARRNIEKSGLEGVTAEVSDLLAAVPPVPADMMLANIVSDILLRLAPSAPAYIRRGGLLAASGILCPRAEEVKAGFLAAGFSLVREKQMGDWVALLLRRE